MRIISFIVIALMLGSLVLLLQKHFPHVLDSDQNKVALISSLTIISFMLMRIVTAKPNFAETLKHLGSWLLIALLILTGYSYQLEINQYSNRLAANLIPGYGEGNGDGSVTFYMGDNGHFAVTALVNDMNRIHFLFDTGASTVALTKEDAEKIGINTENLNYNMPLNTANGISWSAPVRINKIQVGPITVYNVNATVSSGGLDGSLLGMSFLTRLKSYVIQGNTLTLVN